MLRTSRSISEPWARNSAAATKSAVQGFYGASPHDPHPDTKKGYASHLDAEHSAGGRPSNDLPAAGDAVLSHQDAIGVIEETVHGPWTSPSWIGPNRRPTQKLQRLDPGQLSGLNPIKIAEPYRDPVVRQGVLDVSLLAVAHCAAVTFAKRSRGLDPGAELQAGFDRYVSEIYSWIRGDSDHTSHFARLMDSFVRRADKGYVSDLAKAIEVARLNSPDADETWAAYDAAGKSMQEKADFVAQFREDHRVRHEEDW